MDYVKNNDEFSCLIDDNCTRHKKRFMQLSWEHPTDDKTKLRHFCQKILDTSEAYHHHVS